MLIYFDISIIKTTFLYLEQYKTLIDVQVR